MLALFLENSMILILVAISLVPTVCGLVMLLQFLKVRADLVKLQGEIETAMSQLMGISRLFGYERGIEETEIRFKLKEHQVEDAEIKVKLKERPNGNIERISPDVEGPKD